MRKAHFYASCASPVHRGGNNCESVFERQGNGDVYDGNGAGRGWGMQGMEHEGDGGQTNCLGLTWARIRLMDSPSDRPSKST